ncbi:MAG: hypothetical protein JXI33_04940 [Candidatus Aminicenantes bacterium]|nr:hypothetical protein [Candidatus Aminicenantes bacterium]
MGIPVFLFTVLAALAILVLAAWAFLRALKGNRRVSMRQAVALMACCFILWLGLSFFFMILASLGHSSHTLRDAWPPCAVSFFLFVFAPLSLFAWLSRQRSGRDKTSSEGGMGQ